jgi:exosortase A
MSIRGEFMSEDSNDSVVDRWLVPLVALGLSIAWVLFWYRETALAMVGIWTRSETFTHAFLVPPISLWLIWRRRRILAAMTPSSCLPMVGLIGLAGFAWLLGSLAAINSVTQLALVSLVVLAVPTILGMRPTKAMLFPLGYLFFAVPIGEFVMPQFMEWTADFTVLALRATGIPVFREGQHFVIPSGSWSVVAACSGVRYLIASVVVGTLYAYLSYRSLKKRLIFIGVSLIVPIVANWVRAYLIVMLGHLSNNTIATGVDHLVYGWVFFGVVMVLLYMVGARWAETPAPDEPPDSRSDRAAAREKPRNFWIAAAVLAVVALLPPAWSIVIDRQDEVASPTLLLPAIEGWQAEPASASDWRPTFSDPSAELRSVVRQGTREVGLFIGYYRQQTFERKLISSENVLVKPGDPDWRKLATGRREIQVSAQSLTVRTAELRAVDGRRLLAWQWYWVNGRLTSSDYVAKAYTAWARLLGQGDDSAVIVLFAPQDDARGADATLESFVQSAGGAIDMALRNVRETKGAAQ